MKRTRSSSHSPAHLTPSFHRAGTVSWVILVLSNSESLLLRCGPSRHLISWQELSSPSGLSQAFMDGWQHTHILEGVCAARTKRGRAAFSCMPWLRGTASEELTGRETTGKLVCMLACVSDRDVGGLLCCPAGARIRSCPELHIFLSHDVSMCCIDLPCCFSRINFCFTLSLPVTGGSFSMWLTLNIISQE